MSRSGAYIDLNSLPKNKIFHNTDFIHLSRKQNNKWARRDFQAMPFELGSVAPEATRMPSYPTGPDK